MGNYLDCWYISHLFITAVADINTTGNRVKRYIHASVYSSNANLKFCVEQVNDGPLVSILLRQSV